VQRLDNIPKWFWELLEQTKPSLAALENQLEKSDKEKLEAYYRSYREASEAICDYWSGPKIDDEKGAKGEE
jgi:hypothetical protein